MNNNMSWLNLGNYINPKARNTELSNDYNQLTNRPIITLTGTSQNPIKLWKLDVGLYILNGYVQHTDALLSEARGLFVSATVGIVNGKYVISAFIPFWEGQYEYILPSLNSETYTEHQMIRMITQGNSLTLDNIREYFPTQDYHPTTKKYVDETMDAIRNELGKMGLNNNDVQSLIKENRRRDIAIQALLSQNSDKMVTIDEEVHNISMDYSLDKGIATINTLEGDTLVNVSKDTEYDKVLSYEQDIVENTNTVDLEVDGNLNPIIVGDTLVNVCTQNNPTAITNEYTVEGNNHFALQDEAEGNCRPIIQGNTIVNRSKTKDITPLTTYVSEVEGNEMSLVDDTDTHVRVDKLVGDTMVNLWREENVITSYRAILENHRIKCTTDTNKYHNFFIDDISMIKPSTTYTCIVNIYKNTLNEKIFIFSSNATNNDYDIYSQNDGITWYIEGGKVGQFKLTFTTPNEITATRLFRSFVVNETQTEGQKVELNIMLLEGDYTNKPIPQEYFEGLKNSYEDEYIPENLMSPREIICVGGALTVNNNIYRATRNQESSTCYLRYTITDIISSFKPNTIYTIVIPNFASDGGVTHSSCVRLYDRQNKAWISEFVLAYNGKATLIKTSAGFNPSQLELLFYAPSGHTYIECSNEIMILEGDYSSNPPIYEEVMEHSGKYRCEVEVQGKNLFDGKLLKSSNSNDTHISVTDNGNGSYSVIGDGTVGRGFVGYFNAKVKPNTKYMFNYKINGEYSTEKYFIYVYKGKDKIWSQNNDDILTSVRTVQPFTIPNNVTEITIAVHYMDLSESCTISDIQLEEGNTVTAYEPYYNQTQTVYLNSPLLKGDEVVYKEGKLCHYHKMNEVVLDGSNYWENWKISGTDNQINTLCMTVEHSFLQNLLTHSNLNSDKFPSIQDYKQDIELISIKGGYFRLRILKSKLSTTDLNGFKQWLQSNPTTVVYELRNPYYETISTSELLLPITTNCKLLTSSNIPLTTMSTRVFTEEVNILANTQYSLNFNSDIASTVDITLGGTVLSNQAIVKGYNKFSITTPSTLVDNLLIIEGSGVNISEVVVTEYDEGVCEYIEGLKSSFEDGWIPSEEDNLAIIKPIDEDTITGWYNITAKLCPLNKIKPNIDYTLIYNLEILSTNSTAYRGMDLTTGKTSASGNSQYFDCKNGLNIIKFKYGEKPFNEEHQYIFIRPLRRNTTPVNGEYVTYKASNFYLFEGDWTHLHLTEEDFNHLGQYKVEYKVVGKNKFFGAWIEGSLHPTTGLLIKDSRYILSQFLKVQPDVTYSTSITVVPYFYNNNFEYIGRYDDFRNPWITPNNCYYVRLRISVTNSNKDIFQLEEGTVVTEYEPYKESIQTVYLNSPLLKGDTIEEIDGEVYHVHRYYRTILNGNEYWCENSYTEQHENKTYIARYSSYAITPKIKSYGDIKCDKVTGRKSSSINYPSANDLMHDNWAWYLILSKNKLSTPDTKGFKQWLSENPITIVYRLAEPIYELIPSSSIVCKSYPNGHLDFDTNVHINNTVNFVKANLPITYANTSTNYKLQFVSNKDMENVTINALGNIMENVTITKGLNKISFTSPSDATNILTFEGIGYAYISNVQLVATEKDIDYFKGLYSTYECGLIEDESNENYGKYEVNIVSYNAPIQFGKGGKIE